jgi:hypothetical protein
LICVCGSARVCPACLGELCRPPAAAALVATRPAGVGTLQRRHRRQGGAVALAQTPPAAEHAPLSSQSSRPGRNDAGGPVRLGKAAP